MESQDGISIAFHHGTAMKADERSNVCLDISIHRLDVIDVSRYSMILDHPSKVISEQMWEIRQNKNRDLTCIKRGLN